MGELHDYQLTMFQFIHVSKTDIQVLSKQLKIIVRKWVKSEHLLISVAIFDLLKIFLNFRVCPMKKHTHLTCTEYI